ncbi:MAG: asparagine synthase (glutamine-hydrolyzing) [Armatimonadetes bacterium]|nr:asparagine synthase (glutamine-hydrolyzing) [Armatimonadota bacterium]
MCGIAGIYGPNSKIFNIREMIRIQKHRGPDAGGYYEGDNISLGHCRLKILDLTEAGNQPMTLKRKDIWVIFNGEIYNYIELKEKLGISSFATKTDTEVLLRAYERWDIDCLKYLNGMFSFAIWDNYKKRLFCARDRLGIKPFYYRRHGENFLFSSEIKPLLIFNMSREVEEKILFDYLYYGHYEHSEKTFFKGIYKLKPGNYLLIENNGEFKIRPYWRLSDFPQTLDFTKKEIENKFVEILDETVKMQCRSDVPVGISLSGGIDSSILLSFMKKYYNGPLHSFSYFFDMPEYNESSLIKKVADEFEVSSHLTKMSAEEFWEDLKNMTWHLEEPFGGVPTSAYAKMYLETVKNKVIVLLNGNGFDELLGGYNSHYLAYLKDLSLKDEILFNKEAEIYSRKFKLDKNKVINKIIKTDFKDMLIYATDATLPINRKCLNKDFLSKFQKDFPSFNLKFEDNLRKLMYKDLRYTKLPRALRFNDRISMRFGRELRVPFLNHHLVEFCYSLPPEYLFHKGETKYLLRKISSSILPDWIRNIPKKYVQNPQREWFRGALKSKILDLINSKSFKDRIYFDHKEVLKSFKDYAEGKNCDNSFYIWQWINLEYWFNTFID